MRCEAWTWQAQFLVCLQCGYWKDLLELLDRLCVGEEEWAARIEAQEKREKGANHEARKAAKKERLKEWRTSLRSIKDADGRNAAKAERAAANAGDLFIHAWPPSADFLHMHSASCAALRLHSTNATAAYCLQRR